MRIPGDRTVRTYLMARRRKLSQLSKQGDPRPLMLKCSHGRIICILWGMYWAVEGEDIVGPYATREECETSTVGCRREG